MTAENEIRQISKRKAGSCYSFRPFRTKLFLIHGDKCLIDSLIDFETLAPQKPNVFKGLRQQIRGIEPPSPAWEAGILPMNYICIRIFLL